MINKERLDFAVGQVVDNCLKVKKGEKALVITDNDTKHIGMPIAERIREVAGDVKVFIMEDFGLRPEDGSNPLQFPKEIADALLAADVSVYAAGGKKNEFASFRKPMIALLKQNKRLRHGHMINISDRIMETGMAVDYSMVSEICRKVYDIVTKAERIRVTTPLGTDFSVTFNPQWTWGNDDGLIKEGHMGNLPAGEVFTCPHDLNGKVVVDGVLGDHFLAKYGVIEKDPLTLIIGGGRVSSVSCPNKELEREFREYISKPDNGNRIGEFAIGTNIGLKDFVGNLLQDEKFPGVHLAVGDSLQLYTGADWTAEIHVDMVIKNTTIDVDGRTIMKDGRFLI